MVGVLSAVAWIRNALRQLLREGAPDMQYQEPPKRDDLIGQNDQRALLWGTQNRRRGWYVRQISTKDQPWRNGDSEGQDLAATHFVRSDTPEPVSVYFVSTPYEEAGIIAALQANRGNSAIAFGLRIFEKDLEGLEIAVDDKEPGTLGVAKIDALHRNLVGHYQAFQALTARILSDQLSGGNRVREVRKLACEYQCREFLKGAVNEVSNRMREKLNNIVHKTPKSSGDKK